VSREKVREYVEATGGGAVPEQGPVVAPPTFAACFTVGRLREVVEDPELGASWNLVHASQAFDLHRPIAVGDVLTCTPVITEIRDRGRMGLLTLETECVDAADGTPVVTSRTGLVFFADDGRAGAGS
jgi:acyl dehydratase